MAEVPLTPLVLFCEPFERSTWTIWEGSLVERLSPLACGHILRCKSQVLERRSRKGMKRMQG